MGLEAFLVLTCCVYVGLGFALFVLRCLIFVLQKPLQFFCCPPIPVFGVLVHAACIDVCTTTTPLYSPLFRINL